jgi:hypothetical protein
MSSAVFSKPPAPTSAETDKEDRAAIKDILMKQTTRLAAANAPTGAITDQIQQWVQRALLLFERMSASGKAAVKAMVDSEAVRLNTLAANTQPAAPAHAHRVTRRAAGHLPMHKPAAANSIATLEAEAAQLGKTDAEKAVYRQVIQHLQQEIHIYDYWDKLL